jgi:3,2-trans-enoyl-CoA isomerase
MITTIEHGAVRELQLARPPANALNLALIRALRGALAQAEQDEVAAMVLSGAPGMFSAGLDVPSLLTFDRAAILGMWNDFYALLRGLALSPVPTVAAVTGHSPAGGAVLSIQCDLRVMAAGDFRIGLNEVRVGLPMPPVIHAVLARLVGAHAAERLCVSGEMVTAEEALRIGLIDEIAAPEVVIERAVARAQELVALPRRAMGATRRLARADLGRIYASDFGQEVGTMLDAWFGAEAQGALHGLVERLAKRAAG